MARTHGELTPEMAAAAARALMAQGQFMISDLSPLMAESMAVDIVHAALSANTNAERLKVIVDTTEIDEALAKVGKLRQAIEDVLSVLLRLREIEA